MILAMPPVPSGKDRWAITVWTPGEAPLLIYVDEWSEFGEPVRIDSGCLIVEPDVQTQTKRAYGPGQWLRYESIRQSSAA